MKTNIGSYDAGVRFIIGCGILFFSVNGLGWWALLGLVPIVTAGVGFCPLYALFRIDTEAREKAAEERRLESLHHPHHS